MALTLTVAGLQKASKKSLCPAERLLLRNLACCFSCVQLFVFRVFSSFIKGKGSGDRWGVFWNYFFPPICKVFVWTSHTYSSGKYFKCEVGGCYAFPGALFAVLAPLPCFLCTNTCASIIFKACSSSFWPYCSYTIYI